MGELEEELKEEWFGQGLNAVPLIFQFAALSIFSMEKDLGYSYTKFMCSYKKGYADVHYWKKDLDRLSIIIYDRLKNKGYLKDVTKKYRQQMKLSEAFYRKIDNTDIQKVDNKLLYEYASVAGKCLIDSVGVMHIIEPFSLLADSKIREMLKKEIDDKERLNEYFSLLTSPSKKSFFSEYDEMLIDLKKKKSRRLAEDIHKKFFWVKNSYAGKSYFSADQILEEASLVNNAGNVNYEEITKERKELIKRLKLSKEIIFFLDLASIFAELQDERKKNVLIAIDYFTRLVDEIEKRKKLEKGLIYYLLPEELKEGKIDVTNLKKRKENLIVVQKKDKTLHSTDAKLIEKDHHDIESIAGTPASSGIAVGKVKICKNISQIGKVQEGDILVTSMTRPEYVPAMRKAAGIITDEGGITCHAAVVARELKIPCIIGTKIATKVLKDNMLVKIRANHGIIEIVEK
jgi:phosphoenolpyruvate synthase/pyruvate phosphate dikinase